MSKQNWAYPHQHLQQLLWRVVSVRFNLPEVEERKLCPLRYYANCVSTTLTVLILHNVENVYFFYSNPVWKEYPALYMKTGVDLWQYVTAFFSEWEMLQTSVVEKIKTHILWSINFFQKTYHLWDHVKKYGKARHATNDNIKWPMHFACWITNATDTHTQNM